MSGDRRKASWVVSLPPTPEAQPLLREALEHQVLAARQARDDGPTGTDPAESEHGDERIDRRFEAAADRYPLAPVSTTPASPPGVTLAPTLTVKSIVDVVVVGVLSCLYMRQMSLCDPTWMSLLI